MGRRHVIADVEEKGLNPELPHKDLSKGRLAATVSVETQIAATVTQPEVQPKVEPAPKFVQQTGRVDLSRRGRKGKLTRNQDDPAVD